MTDIIAYGVLGFIGIGLLGCVAFALGILIKSMK